MSISQKIYFILAAGFFISMSMLSGGCAQIGVPTGGPKDTLAPKVIRASPPNESRNVTTNKITLEFNEYIDVQDLQQNLLISPLQNRNPSIIANTRSITLKFRDSLLPNTTYTINFGDAVRDINENNIYRNLTYTFSTGSTLDSLSLSGKVLLAETGNPDSTLLVLLYRNATDSTVQKKKPNYIARVRSDGSFIFKNLPGDAFSIYALGDGDGGKTYNSLSEPFAFTNKEVIPGQTNDILLYAYSQEKAPDKATPAPKLPADKRLRILSQPQGAQDLLESLQITFNNPLAEADSARIIITDTSFKKIAGTKFSLDSTAKKITFTAPWQQGSSLVLLVPKDAVKDSAGANLLRNDTLRFTTKRTEDYGKLILRFSDLDLNANPVLQFLVNGTVKYSYPLRSAEWTTNMFVPGDYGVRILYDTDKNGVFTPGNYKNKQQPETAVTLPQTLNVRADWDNEREINL